MMQHNRSEVKHQEAAENRAMNFQREQSTFAVGSAEDNAELMEREQKSDLIKWQQDLEDELMELVYQLKGWKKIGGEWIKPMKPIPLCNELFINDVVIPQCKSFLSRNFINSNFSEDRLLDNMERTSNDIADNMADGYFVYGIKFENYPIVTRLIKNLIKASSFRAINGFTKKTDSTIFKRIESSMENAREKEKRGIFGFRS